VNPCWRDVYHCFWRQNATYRIKVFDCDSFHALQCIDDGDRAQIVFVSKDCSIDNLQLKEQCILVDAGFGHMPEVLPQLPAIDTVDVEQFQKSVSKCRKDILHAQQFNKESSEAVSVVQKLVALTNETSPNRLEYHLKPKRALTKLKAVQLFAGISSPKY
jgi:hypothetical protein